MNKFIASAMIVFSVVIVSTAIVYALNDTGFIPWSVGEDPQAAPGEGNVRLSWSNTDGVNIYSNATGNVGIGTTDPQYKFQLLDQGRYYSMGTVGDASGYALNTDSSLTGAAFMAINADRKLWIESGWNSANTAQQDLILQTQGGYVGIGTAIPAEKLDVVGNIAATGTVCDGTGTCIGGGVSSIVITDYEEYIRCLGQGGGTLEDLQPNGGDYEINNCLVIANKACGKVSNCNAQVQQGDVWVAVYDPSYSNSYDGCVWTCVYTN